MLEVVGVGVFFVNIEHVVSPQYNSLHTKANHVTKRSISMFCLCHIFAILSCAKRQEKKRKDKRGHRIKIQNKASINRNF